MVYGMLTAGAAGGSAIVLPVATAMLGISLRASLLTLAALCLLGSIAVVRTVPDLPGRTRGMAPTPISEMFRERRFWLLLVPFFVCGYTTTGMIETHLIPFALDHHVAQATASAALATLAAFNIMGVLLAGGLTDRVDRGRMLAGIYIMRAATLLILPFVTGAGGLFIFGALFGIADFSTVPPTTSLTRTVFKTGSWAVALGIISAAHQVGSAMGAWLSGVLFEQTGSYNISFVSGAVALMIAGYLSWLLRRPSAKRVEPAPTAI
jgi:predicted MFS family arabinose efflux permease